MRMTELVALLQSQPNYETEDVFIDQYKFVEGSGGMGKYIGCKDVIVDYDPEIGYILK